MKKATLKTYLLILIVLMLSVAIALTAFACKSDQQAEEEPVESTVTYDKDVDGNLITNGNFSADPSSSSATQLYTPSNWSTYTTSTTVGDDSVKGVIDTGDSDFAANSSEWNGVNPYGDVKDQRLLMIYNKTDAGNVYGYTATFNTDAYGYYKVSAKVKVQDVTAGGATFRVHTDNGFVAFDRINDTDAFKTYTIYFAASSAQSDTVTVTLSLGYGTTKVKGYAFFDDVVALKISAKEYNEAAAAEASSQIKFGSFTYPDGEFGYTSGDGDYRTPTSWSGTSKHTDSNGTLDHVGVISVADWDEAKTEKYGADPMLPAGSTDSDVLAIFAESKTEGKYAQSAYYYQSKDVITIVPSHLYEISLYVKATVDADDSIVGKEDKKGAQVVLYDTKESKDLITSGMINTTGNATDNGWKKVVFRVLGDPYETKTFAVRLWLGSEEEDNYTQGKVYFDRFTVTELSDCFLVDRTATAEEIADLIKNAATPIDDAAYQTYNFLDLGTESADVTTYEAFKAVKEGEIPEDWSFERAGTLNSTDTDVIVKVIKDDFTNENVNWKETYGLDENPLYPYSFSSALMINNIYPSSYKMVQTDNYFKVNQNAYYRISLWIKTVGLEDDDKISVTLMTDTKNDNDTSNDSSIASFSVDTASTINDLTNGYVEYSFYIQGAPDSLYDEEKDDRYVYFVVTNGSDSATAYDPSEYQKGAFLIADIHCETITYKQYSDASNGDYIKTYEFERTSSSADSDSSTYTSSSTNWDFNTYNKEDVEMDDETQLMKGKTEDGKVQVGKASSWTSKAGESYGIHYSDGKEQNIAVEKKEKTADDEEKAISEDIEIDKISRILLSGDLKKSFTSSSAWEKYLKLDAENSKIGWGDNRFILSPLTGAQYDLTLSISVNGTVTDYLTFANNEIAWSDKASVLPAAEYKLTIKVNKIDGGTRTVNDFTFTKDPTASNKEEFVLAKEDDKEETIASITMSATVALTLNKAAGSTVDFPVPIEKDENGNKVEPPFTIKTITMSGAVEYVFTKSSEWNSYFTINEEDRTIKLSSSEYIAGKTYTITIKADEQEEYKLIGGIINVNNADQLNALGLDRSDIYNIDGNSTDWDNVSEDAKLLPSDFGAPYLYILTNRVTGEPISLKNATNYDKSSVTDLTKTPVLKTSSSISLEANHFYVLTFYAKTLDGAIGEVHISNNSYNMTMPYLTIENTNGWMEYNFFIEVGLNNTNVYFEVYYGEKGNEDDTYTGTLLLDSFSKRTFEPDAKEDYEALRTTIYALNNDAYSNKNLVTVSFDKDTTSTSAVDPTGLSEENSSTTDIVSGIIYKETFNFSNIKLYKDETSVDAETGNEVTSEVVDTTKTFTKEDIFNNDELTGDYLLIINNIKRNYQQYSLSASLSAGKYYKYSVLLRTLSLEDGKTATVLVTSDNENYSMNVDTQGEWKEFTFYLSNTKDASSSAKFAFRLGENNDEGKIRGILLIDNVTMTEITKADYDAQMAIADQVEKDENGNVKKDANGNVIATTDAAREFYASSRSVVIKEATSATDDTDDSDNSETSDTTDTDEKQSIDTSFLWLYITSIVIAIALIVIIAIWLYKRYRRPGKTSATKTVSYDRNKKSDGTEEKSKSGSARDEYKD